MDLAKSLGDFVDSRVRTDFHWAEVTGSVSSPVHSCSIKLSGSDTAISGVRYLKSYSPSTSDIVLVACFRGDMVILGELQ